MDERWNKLTAAERRVVELACEGLTNPAIGQRLSISPRTVQRHLYEIFRKVGVASRSALVAEAVRRGFDGGSAAAPPDGRLER